MAVEESSGQDARSVGLALADVGRLAELAYRHIAWLSRDDDEETPAQFAEGVAECFQSLLADHAEKAGYPFLCKGYGALVAASAAEIPAGWRPGWPKPGATS